MTTYLPGAFAGQLTGRPLSDEVCSAAVEQVMRCCDDDLAVLPFLDVAPGSQSAAAALGRLMSEYPALRLVAGCPLMALVSAGPVAPRWREHYPPAAESLFSHLEFLVSMYGPPSDDVAGEPYAALEQLRHRSEADLSA